MDAAHERLTALLRGDPAPEVRREAARALSVTMDAGAVDHLVAALADPDGGVCRAATLALGRVRDARAVEALLDVLASRPELWQEAAAALANTRDATLVPRLLPLLDAHSVQVRQGAIRAIAAVCAPLPTEEQPLFVYTDEEGHRHPLF
jgi:HEAT repeat protein